MNTTILVSAAEVHEQQVHLGTFTVKFPDGLIPEEGLSNEQMRAMMEKLAPVLKARRLQDFHRMEMLYLVDGVPAMEQGWIAGENSHEDGRRVDLGMGWCLWFIYSNAYEGSVISLS